MTRHRIFGGAALWLTLGASLPATAQRSAEPSERVTLIANGAFDISSVSYAQTIAITEFVEQGSLRSNYSADPGPGFDVGLQLRLVRGLVLTTALSRVSRTAVGDVAASIPHPLYFDRPRSAARDLDGLNYSEQAAHLGIGWQAAAGPTRLILFGGVSLFRVSSDLVTGVDFAQSYPYDAVSLTGVRSAERDQSPTGFHLGGRFDWKLGELFGLGAQLRFSRAKARLDGDSAPLEIDAGGLQLAAGLRLFF